MTTPREYDAVKGGENLPPGDAVILGGIEGVKHRFGNSDLEVRIAALKEAWNYGYKGLELIIRA